MQTQLTAKQESFALLVAEVDPTGKRVRNLSDSYREAYCAERMTAKSINEAASRLRHDRKVAARIEALTAENEALRRENAAYTLEKGAEWIIAKLWELADDRGISASARIRSEDRTFKLHSGKTSEYGRYVKSLWEAPWRARGAPSGTGAHARGRPGDGVDDQRALHEVA